MNKISGILVFMFGLFFITIPSQAEFKVLQGNLTPGGFVLLQVVPNMYLSYRGKVLKSDNKGRVLIGFGRNYKPKQTIKKLDSTQKTIGRFNLTLKPRYYDVQKISGLPKNKVSPNKKTLIKIRQDIKKAKQARKINLPKDYFNSGFVWPTFGIVSGIYGSQRVLNGKLRRSHLGVDIAAPKGREVLAPSDGKITLSTSMELSGNTVMIDHGWGLRSTLMHLNKSYVKVNDMVKKGQVIGEVGQTGRATGPHVHWGMSWFNTRLDPALSLMNAVTLKKMDKIKENR